MAEIYFASSVAKANDYDGLITIDHAAKAGVQGVQLYSDNRYLNPRYTRRVADAIKETRLGVLIHLPNEPTGLELAAAANLSTRTNASPALIHYLPTLKLPDCAGVKIGWENSKTGAFYPNHVNEVWQRALSDETFFVFDIGRILYCPRENKYLRHQITDFVRSTIGNLRKIDYLHLADKTGMDTDYRSGMCAEGQGVDALFLDHIRAFPGVVVFEHEDLQMAIDGVDVIRGK